MRFSGLKIEKSWRSDKDNIKFRGQISFETEDNSIIWLNIDDEWSRKFILCALPLLEKATNEKMEIIRKEIEDINE